MRQRTESGFTLIEILVVIAIITVLAGILFPVLTIARERGYAASCQSNLRQIGAAFDLYLQDWDDFYPDTDDPFLWMGRKWRWPLMTYISAGTEMAPNDPMHARRSNPGIFICPSDTTAKRQWDGTSYAYSLSFYHSPEQINTMTAIEQTWTEKLPCIPQNSGAVKFPGNKALVSEWLSNHASPHAAWNSWEGARNYLFADGHCKYIKAGRINPANDGWPDINVTRDGIFGKDID